ncbi:MAG: hypothetical protein WCW33_06105 [Candidatus Babeliales bacterium]|jgi:ankyrin repeat protein
MKFKYLILASAVCSAWYVGIQAEKPAPDIQELSEQLWKLTKDGGAKNAQEILQRIKTLLDDGANPTIRFGDYSKTSSIENAMKRKDLVMLAAIFDWPDTGEKVWRKKIDSPVGDSFSSYTLLMQACESKNPALIAFFLKRGANPNATTDKLFGVNTTLSMLLGDVHSVDGTTLKCLQELLKEGANPVSLEETLIKKVSNNPNAIFAISDLESHMKQEFQVLFEQLQRKIGNQEYATGDALLKDPLYKIISELLAARIIYTANIKPLSEKAGLILARIFKGYLEITGTFVAADKNFDPINNPYPYGKDDVKGKTPVELLAANGNSGYLAMLLEAKRADNGEPLVFLTTAQNALTKTTDAQCKALLQHFIGYETALTEHSDIMPFKDEELKNIETLLHMLAQNIEKKRYKDDEEGEKARKALTTTIADRLHALLIYEVSKPSKEDKTIKTLRRGDSKMVEKYLRYVNGLRLMDPTKTLVDQPFQYGDETVKGKTPIQLAQENKHKYCLNRTLT